MNEARSLTLFVVAAAAISIAPVARAQEAAPFGARADNIIVVDELVGVYRETISHPDASNSSESGLIRVGSHAGAFALNETTRFGYHRMLTPTISLGTGIHFLSRDISFELGSGKETILGVSPRIGFVFAPSTSGALWLRVGFQYYHRSLGDNDTAWDMGPGAELFYVITPFEHFGITLGPTVELQLAGNESHSTQVCGITGGGCVTTSRDEAVRRYTFGLALGFLFDL
jgi:hypothetical protein